MLKKLVLGLCLALLSVYATAQKSFTDSTGTEFLIPADFKAKYDAEAKSAQLIDVRTPDEFKKSHLPNAVNINYYSTDFIKNIGQLDKSKNTYIYCATGGRSKATASALRQQDFKGKLNVISGFYIDLGLLYGIKPEPLRNPNKF